jgi:sugar lactone lactonase YvrE
MKRLLAVLLPLLAAAPAAAQDMPLSQILLPDQPWKQHGKWLGFDVVTADHKGNLYLADADRQIIKATEGQQPTIIGRATHPVVALAFDREDRLHYLSKDGQVVRLEGNDEKGMGAQAGAASFVLAANGDIYCTVPKDNAVYRIAGSTSAKVADVPSPGGLALWPDGATLVVASKTAPALWAFRVQKDGSLDAGERYYQPVRVRGKEPSGTGGLTVDRIGRLYAATPLGDPTGRPCGVLLPAKLGEATIAVVFAGNDLDLLVCVCGDRLYARQLKTKGVGPVPAPKP